MDTRARGRLGTIAAVLLVALLAVGGTATAAKLITGKDVKDASLTGTDVKNSSLTGTDVKNSSLTGGDVKDGSLSPADFSGSVQGPAGPAGAPGAPGAKGDPGTSALEVVSESFNEVFIVNSGGQRGLSEVKSAACPAGKKAISGGYDLGTDATQNGQARQVTVSASGPATGGTGWSVQLFNNSTSIDTSIDLKVTAVCATVG
jgi:hypothetical protein